MMPATSHRVEGEKAGSRVAKFDYRVIEGWPPLAWVARWRAPESGLPSNITVYCGTQVERRKTWFGECIWAGEFEEGAFDKTETVFGSGGCVSGSKVGFVSAASTVDRLHVHERGEEKAVSNSLIALCAVHDLTFDPYYPGYYSDFRTVSRGLGKYKPIVSTRGGDVRLVYHDNITWDGTKLSIVAKPHPGLKFGRFEDYRDYMSRQVGALIRNAQDPGRIKPFKAVATLSNGYDSTAVCSLASAVGVKECFGFIEGYPSSADDLKQVASALGIGLNLQRKNGTQRDDLDAVALLLASGTAGYESHFLQIEQELASTLLFTGFHGDGVWGLNQDRQNVLQRAGGGAGLSFTEYRLHVPFVHAPIPYLGARQLEELKVVGNSPEMAPWRLGGKYDRPIARRLAEDRGVPRGAFGKRKYAASVALHSCQTVSDAVQADMSKWIHNHWNRGVPLRYRISKASLESRKLGADILTRLGWCPSSSSGAKLKGALRSRLMKYPLFRYTFPWAVERVTHRYTEALKGSTVADRLNDRA